MLNFVVLFKSFELGLERIFGPEGVDQVGFGLQALDIVLVGLEFHEGLGGVDLANLGLGLVAGHGGAAALNDGALLFARVVPNIKKLGLLTPTVRRAFEEMQIIQFEDLDSDAQDAELGLV